MSSDAVAPEELPVFIMGPGADPERLILLGRPEAGRVRVREWSGADWSAPPVEREVACGEISDQFAVTIPPAGLPTKNTRSASAMARFAHSREYVPITPRDKGCVSRMMPLPLSDVATGI